MRISFFEQPGRAPLLVLLACTAFVSEQTAHAFTLTQPVGGSAITVENAATMRFAGTCDENEKEIRVSFVGKRLKGLENATKHEAAKCNDVVVGRRNGSKGKVITARVWSTTMDLSRLPEGRVSILVSSGERISGVNLVKDMAPTLVSVASYSAPKRGLAQVSAEGGCSKNGQNVVLTVAGDDGLTLSTICRNSSWSFRNVDLSEIDKESVAIEIRHTNELTGETDASSFAIDLPQQNEPLLGLTNGERASVANVSQRR